MKIKARFGGFYFAFLSACTIFAPMKIGNIEFGPYPVFLAPMEDVTDIGFRLLCKRFGASMVYSEFVAADALVRMVNRSLEKLAVCDDERPVAIQIYGKEPGAVADAARIVVERAHPDVLDLNTWNMNASYSYGGRRIAAGVNMNSSQLFDRVGLSANLSTSTVFADGLFAIASSIPSNFLLVSQKGALKGNDLSIGTPGTSSFAETPTTFGTALYTGLPSYGNTSLMVYSSGSDQFSVAQSLAVNLTASDMKGYVLRMEAEDSFSASGMVYLPDGSLWLNGSSPLYSVMNDGNGDVTTTATDSYIFTDSDGRFVVSQLPAGTYGFDVPYEGGWLLYIFPVSDDPDAFSKHQMMGEPAEYDSSTSLPEPYMESYVYEMDEIISSQQFFELLYPEAMEVAV